MLENISESPQLDSEMIKEAEKQSNIDSNENVINEIVSDIVNGEIEENYLEQANKEQLKEVVTRVTQIMTEYHGPIPPPSLMRGYEEILSGSADRILAMAENQASHRQYVERKCVDTEARDSLLGIISAFSLGLLTIVGGVVMAYFNPSNVAQICGLLLGGTGITLIAGTFLKGTRNSWKREDKDSKDNKD